MNGILNDITHARARSLHGLLEFGFNVWWEEQAVAYEHYWIIVPRNKVGSTCSRCFILSISFCWCCCCPHLTRIAISSLLFSIANRNAHILVRQCACWRIHNVRKIFIPHTVRCFFSFSFSLFLYVVCIGLASNYICIRTSNIVQRFCFPISKYFL